MYRLLKFYFLPVVLPLVRADYLFWLDAATLFCILSTPMLGLFRMPVPVPTKLFPRLTMRDFYY